MKTVRIGSGGLPSVRWSRAEPTRPGFTLIELLVVIAVIGILASLLLPALTKAKDEATRIACTNHQKQLILAMVFYYHDNSDYLPWPNWDSQSWPGVLGWLYTGPLSSGKGAPPGRPGTVESGALWPYLKNRLVYFCPLDLQRTNSPAHPPDAWQTYKQLFDARANQLTSFICNGAVIGYGVLQGNSVPNTFKVDRFKPTNYLLWETDERESWYFNDGASTPAEGFSLRHHYGATVGAIGGHAVYLKYATWYKLLNIPGLNDFWCNPTRSDGRW